MDTRPYDFGYSVNDRNTGADFRQQETSDGNQVKGQYRVQLPDGRLQIVTYTADWQTGFHADVQYEGEASYPAVYGIGGSYPPSRVRTSYGVPSSSYGAPSTSYSAPSTSYSAPSTSYSAPSTSYSAPSTGYSAPSTSYSAPSSSYSAPAASSNYVAPTVSPAVSGYAPPPSQADYTARVGIAGTGSQYLHIYDTPVTGGYSSHPQTSQGHPTAGYGK